MISKILKARITKQALQSLDNLEGVNLLERDLFSEEIKQVIQIHVHNAHSSQKQALKVIL
jgi:hypothetical protein